MKKYTLVFMPSFEPGSPDVLLVKEKSMSSTEMQKRDTLFSSQQNTRDYLDTGFDVPESLIGRGTDLIGNLPEQQKLEDWFADNQTINQRIGHYTAAALAIAVKVINVKFYVEFRFADNCNPEHFRY
ncbi:hypothetical protein FM038_007640 [Shewanella eurypsychrophilus]|uniref:Uncharacterized protein n=1 Tax=Shewanella eurypsychrophilus TaxID=2593656 RepID=A0ABX6V401_9GAMM|nr:MULTISPECIES: hypothetical protein [Shewanella]QFU22031.1 hypothetical protein FS418_09220 [Shewanella sp. YLB-09]QPG57320.1 hypothetical protein FM038_007640 [Shewanella eurypsychrophilus]